MDFGGPGGGPLDPDRKMMQIPGGFVSVAPTVTPFRPKRIFGYLGEIGFQRNCVFVLVKPQTPTTKMTVGSVRSFHVFIKNYDLGWFLPVKLDFLIENQHCQFSV